MNRKSLLAVLVPALITLMATDAAAARPDLQVRSLSATLDGGTVRVDAGLRGASSTVAYHLSADGKLDARDRRIGLKRGKGRQRVAFKLPAGLAPGSYRLIACVDARKRVRERNERNNCRTAPQPIVIAGKTVGSDPGGGGPQQPPPAEQDTTAPDTRITAGPEGATSSRSASFAFVSTEHGSTFECRADGSPFAPCASPEDLADLADGTHDFAVRATDRAGNVDATPATRAWTVDGDDGPQSGPKDPPAEDPVAEAPPLPATGTTTMEDATKFLYTGADPIQKDVAPGAIAEKRVAVLRGRVLNRMGGAIAGVRVTVLGHPELGRTSTRDDGGFDLAINGGGTVVLSYERAGWMPVQRTVQAPWQDYAHVDDVVMAPYDDAVTEIDLDSTEDIQVHQATAVTDQDGRRQATLMFAKGTDAEMVLPDGTKQPLDDLAVRATEYTVGDSGREAMPGALPAASGYTYAVELSVDEAIEAGATEVRFDQPVINYVDNFLGFPVGGRVPTGYYDREAGRWVAADNGRVIEIVGESGGKADVDTDGDGAADDGAALGITDAERERLAALHDPGKSLWRIPIEHFTPWDHNWPFAPPLDSVPPRVPVPNADKPQPKKECWVPGSIIGCEGQRLGQTVGVAGTPFSLRYWSDRTPGYVDEHALNVPLVPTTLPSGLQKVVFQIEVAGRHFAKTYEPTANLANDFVWDGKDAYGRKLRGAQPVTVRIGYQYGLVEYASPLDIFRAFGRVSGNGIVLDAARGRQDMTVWREYRDETQTTIGGFDARDQALGGWTLDAHHWFDARSHTVHLGGGGRINADPIITTAAGNGRWPVIPRQGDGQHGLNVPLGDLGEAEVGPDGTVYFVETVERSDGTRVGNVRKIDADGHVRTLATNLGAVIGIAVADDGTVYAAESIQHRVKRITPNGMVFPFAGGGTATGEGIPATTAKLSFPSDVAVAPDGGVYIAENILGGGGTIDHGLVRHVGADGLITTVAGGGDELGDGGPAREAKLASGSGVAVGSDGLLVIATRDRIRKLDAGGRISTIAGGGDPEDGNGDGGPATEARVDGALAVDVMTDGGVLFVDGGLVRRVTPDGMVHRAAGGGSCGPTTKCDIGDRGPSAQAVLPGATGVAVAPDGAYYVTTSGDELDSGRIRRVARPLVRQHGGRGMVPSTDGTQAYEFDERGRHLRTLDGLTGDVLLTFAYDDAGRLTAVTDADGNATTIERAPDGQPRAIVAPGGQRTELTVNGDGWLERVENPAGETTRLEYKPDGKGLMSKLIDPRGNPHEFGYTPVGRLVTDKDPELGVQKLDLEKISGGYRVTRTSPLGRTQTFSLQKRLDGLFSETRSATGARTTVLTRNDGAHVVTYPDGTKVEAHREPDPQWGFNAPMITSYKVTTPEGRVDETTIQRTAVLGDQSDPLSVISLTDQMKTGNRTTKTVYDAEARTLISTSPVGRTTTTTLDAVGHVARVDQPGQDAIVVTRDDRGRLERIEQGAQRWTYEYDAKDRVEARTDAAGKRTEYGYDDADRVTSIKRPSGRVYGFAYDAGGAPKSVTMPDGDVHELGHGKLDQLERFKPSGSAAAHTREYDLDRGLTKVKLAGGRVITHGRDEQTGRPTGQGYQEAQVGLGFDDATDRLSKLTWDGPGAGDPEQSLYTYDGQMPKSVTASGTSAGRYDYTYGAGQLLSNIRLTSGTTTLDTALVRDNDGLVTGFGPFTFGRTNHDAALKISEGAFNHDMTFDGQRRLATRTVKVGAQQPYKVELTRNVRGQIERRLETVSATTADYRYEYDGDGRLLTVKKDGALVEEYDYDANGNRRTRRVGGGPVEELGYDGQERLATRGSTVYGFDADGFLSTRGGDQFSYSARGELLRAEVGGTIVTYAYDGFGRRVSRTQGVATTQYLYGNPADPFQVTATRDAAGVVTAYYYDEAGHLFAMRRGTTRFYVATDQVGTPRVVINANGTVAKAFTYDAFGVQTGDSAPAVELPFGFAGGLADSVTGLVRFGLRDYEPASGRWTARDPALFGGGQANLYDYVGGDPIGQRDPSGLICVGGSVYAGFGGGGQFCITDEGFSLCAEAGFGVGSDLGLDGGGLAENGETIVAEVEGQLGPLKAKIGVELDNTGCVTVQAPEVKLTDNFAVKLNTDTGDVSFAAEPKLEIKNGPEELLTVAKVKVTAKVAAKFCRQAKF